MIAFYTGVFLVLVYLVFPARTAKKESPWNGPPGITYSVWPFQ